MSTVSTSTHARRFLVALAAAGGVTLLWAGPAWAHIHPDPPAVQAGQPFRTSHRPPPAVGVIEGNPP